MDECSSCLHRHVCVIRAAIALTIPATQSVCSFYAKENHPDLTFDEHVERRIRELAEMSGLTSIETGVLSAALNGDAYEDIARDRGVTIHTIRFHFAKILEKIGAETRNDIWRVLRTM